MSLYRLGTPCDDGITCPDCGRHVCPHHHPGPCLCGQLCAECCTCEGEAA